MMAGAGSETSDVRRHLKVEGHDGRCNDILVLRPENASSVVVLFGGDIQHFPEVMLNHPENGRFVDWNVEATARILADKFPSSTVVVILPNKMHQLTYSCYSNFVDCNDTGVPKHQWNYDALNHLNALLKNVGILANSTTSQGSIKLVGFSKGCVVLNQFLHEFHYYHSLSPSAEPPEIMQRTESMYWLDGGHSGGGNTWVTSKSILESFAAKRIEVHVHVTPYQIKDELRPWIGKEEKLFHSTLQDLQVKVRRVFHFEDDPPSIEFHFEVLKKF